jgi:signal transduction histidine kinase
MIGPRSLGWRLAAAMSAVTVSLALLLTVFFQRQTRDLVDGESRERIAALAQHVAAAAVLGTLANSEELLAGALDGAMSQSDVETVAIYDAGNGLIAVRSRSGARAPARQDPTVECRPCLMAGGRLRWVEPIMGASSSRSAVEAGFYEDGPPRAATDARTRAGWVMLEVNTSARMAAERRITLNGLLIGAGVLVAALAVALLVAQRLTSPLRALAQATREIGKGNWDAPIPTPSSNELAQLAADFGAMTSSLATLDRENSRYREGLEEMVASRTRELEGAYQEMKAMAEAKDQFVATVSHDFRSPLAIILSVLQTIKADPEMTPDVRREFLARAERQCKRLGALVNDLLDLARIENRESVFERQSLSEVVDECAENARAGFEGRSVSLMVEKGSEPVLADIDRGLVVRALTNLLDNALRFTPQGGRVTVTLRGSDGEGSIVVSDTGPGIPEEEREHLFERFYQGRHGQSLGSGSGLGLAIVAGVARQHGGRVSATSAPGAGATFDLRLPLSRP